MLRPPRLLLLLLVGASVPVGADAPASMATDDCRCSRGEVEPQVSHSTGYPWRGRLRDGVRLHASNSIHLMQVDIPRGNFFGTETLVNLLRRVAEHVEVNMPGARLNVGELSKRGGGNLIGHRSHENGRDVDIGFYLKDEAGITHEARRFVDVDRRGHGHDGETMVHFDDYRNWLLVKALARDDAGVVQHMFVHRSIRARLLAEGARHGASEELLEKVSRIVISPGVRHPHRNHFHMRIYCPAQDVPGCRDRGPYWPWIPADHPFTTRIVPLPGWPPGS